MDIFKTKAFDKWAKKERLKNTELIQAINEIEKGLVDADLGSGIYKKRISQNNRGKSAGARSFIAYKAAQKAFFLYGFPKNARSNITEKETQALKRERLARDRFRPSMAKIDSHNGAGYWLPRPSSSPATPRPGGRLCTRLSSDWTARIAARTKPCAC